MPNKRERTRNEERFLAKKSKTVAETIPVDIHRRVRWSSASMGLTAANSNQKRDDIYIRRSR